MPHDQLPIFKQKTFGKVHQRQIIEPVAPTGESRMMQILPSYMAYLGERYAEKTAKMYWADVRDLAIFLRDKKVKDITSHNLQQWIETLFSSQGQHLARKTLNRKVSAIINCFLWLL